MLDELHRPFVAQVVERSHDTLPIIRTFLRELLLFDLAIRLKVNRSLFLERSIDTVDCFSF
jgi:hypothetical protein